MMLTVVQLQFTLVPSSSIYFKLPAIKPFDVDNWKTIDIFETIFTNMFYAAKSFLIVTKLKYTYFSLHWNLRNEE